jgi:hypothetical protein
MQLWPIFPFLAILLSCHIFPWHESNWIDSRTLPLESTGHVIRPKKRCMRLFDNPQKRNSLTTNSGIIVFETNQTVSVNGVTNSDPHIQTQVDPYPNQVTWIYSAEARTLASIVLGKESLATSSSISSMSANCICFNCRYNGWPMG